jgi:hypothetical protein
VESSELMTFATRVLERALQKAGYMPEPPVEIGSVPAQNDLLVDSMADKLIAFVNHADAAVLPLWQSAATSPELDSLRARNRRLARALGACDCFGEDLMCARCGGRGSSGWEIPDRSQFEAIVRPTLHKVSQMRPSPSNRQLHSHHNGQLHSHQR